MENLIRKNFTQVPNDLINDSTISRDARFLFVYLCSKPDDWVFRTKVIENDLDCSKDSRIKYMKELAIKGWISTRQLKLESGSFGNVEIELNPYPKFTDTGEVPRPKTSDTGKNGSGKSPTLNNTKKITNTKDLNNTDVLPLFQSDVMEGSDLSVSILKYLNLKKGGSRGYAPSDGNLSDIRARIKEKFIYDDFKRVIDHKVTQWENDPKNRKYLRPETLFASKKFNNYLIEADENSVTNNFNSSRNFVNKEATDDDLI